MHALSKRVWTTHHSPKPTIQPHVAIVHQAWQHKVGGPLAIETLFPAHAHTLGALPLLELAIGISLELDERVKDLLVVVGILVAKKHWLWLGLEQCRVRVEVVESSNGIGFPGEW